MKLSYSICLVAIVALLTFGISGTAKAFHGGGVAHCDGCHTMHRSLDNPQNPGATPNTQLLIGSDPSSTCLSCHNGSGSYRVRSADGVGNPKAGGDFYWVENPYTVVVRGNTNTYGGDNAGHNLVALDYGMDADANPNNATAPGSTAGFPSAGFACTSCHDPHGQVQGGTASGTGPVTTSGSYGLVAPAPPGVLGNYRILGDSAYAARIGPATFYPFTADAPIARANGSSGTSVDYGSGMSEWCGNCHDQYAAGDNTMHAAGAVNGNLVGVTYDYAANYNSYVATGDFTGAQATSYDPLVSFERGAGLVGSDLNNLSTAGPSTGDEQVMCLTCHRAHASAHNNSGRWDFEVDEIAGSHALVSPDVTAGSAIYYKNGVVIDVVAEYGDYQRSLCNKCHVKD